jgi:hypothetical protein
LAWNEENTIAVVGCTEMNIGCMTQWDYKFMFKLGQTRGDPEATPSHLWLTGIVPMEGGGVLEIQGITACDSNFCKQGVVSREALPHAQTRAWTRGRVDRLAVISGC